MKCSGFAAVAMAAVMTVACGDGRDNQTLNDANENAGATVGTGGELAPDAGVADVDSPRDVQNWVRDIAMHNTAEIELGKLASERAMSPDVKQYGQMMVKEHTMAGNELEQAVSGEIQVQAQVDEEHRDLAQRLRGLSGAEFDREYMEAMVDGHQEVVNMLEDRADDANRPAGTTGDNTGTTAGTTGTGERVETAVNQWAAKTLPKVQQHLQQAEQLRDRVNDGGRSTTQQ